MREIDVEILLDKHSLIWHPQRDVREKARAKFRKDLLAIPSLDFWKVIDHVKFPCLLHLRDLYEGMISSMMDRDDPTDLARNLDVGRELNDHLRWICQELGESPRTWFNAGDLVQRARLRNVSGTLMAFGC